jgi:hypothetical protein
MPHRIILEFLGGYWDGQTLDTASRSGREADLARAYYEMVKQGSMGTDLEVSPAVADFAAQHGWEAARKAGFSQIHHYRVAERMEEGTEVLVRLKYAPKEKR